MKRVPKEGIVGETALREAAAGEFNQVSAMVSGAIAKVALDSYVFAMYPDRAIVCGRSGRYYAYPYTIGDDNQVTLGTPVEVIKEFVPAASASAMREAAPNKPASEDAPESGSVHAAHKEPASGGERPAAVQLQGEVFIEAVKSAEGDKPARYLVRVIKSGLSGNGVVYPAAVLREAAPLFNGVRVFAKSDDEHLASKGKDFRQLVGRLTSAKFVEAKDGGGEIQAVLDVLESSDVSAKLREAVSRGMTDLFGLSIDASGPAKKSGRFLEAVKFRKINSVDLIIEPGAGGQLIRFTEAKATPNEETDMLREQMMKFIEARDAKRAGELANATDEEVLTAYNEAVKASNESNATAAAVTQEAIDERFRMIEARANARVAIAEAKLPAAVKERLQTRFTEAASFTADDVTKAIEGERTFLGKLTEDTKVTGLGDFVEAGEDRADKVGKMLDEFFDRSKPAKSFRECYVEMTGDTRVTGLIRNMDMTRLREAVGGNFREAINAATFGDILGDSITRAMVRDYRNSTSWGDWRWLADVVPAHDFRTQERTRMGGFGDLPDVAEGAPYTELAPPGDDKATYAISKRGGLQTITLEAVANDDVGAIRRVPLKMATAAARTLYKFVYSFLDTNAVIYDGSALFIAGHNNLGAAALDAASYAAARLAMFKQTELTSNEPLGLPLRHLAVPSDLEATAGDLFKRDTNQDKTFIQSQNPTIHVVTHWTDANNWFGTADLADTPLIEMGFYNGQEDPETFVQDQPTQGSVFSNDKITYKIRHIYSGTVIDFRGFYGAIVA